MLKNQFNILGILFLLCLVGASQDLQAQKKKHDKKSKIALTDEEKYQAEFYFIEGEKFFLTEDYAKSLEMFSRTLEVNPKNAAAHFKIAEIYMKSGELIKAIPSAMKTLELDPENKYYYLLNANLQTQLGAYPTAAKHYEDFFAKFPGNEDYLFDLATIYQYSGDYEDALATYDKVESFYGKQVEVTREKQKIYQKQDRFDLVMKEWEALLEEKEEEELLLQYVELLLSNNQVEKAQEFVKKSLELNPDNTKSYLTLSDIYRHNGDLVLALEQLEIPFESGGIGYEEKLQVLASFITYLPNEDLQKEIEKLIGILKEEHPKQYQSYAIAGDMYYQAGDKQKALDNYLLSIEQDETNFNVWQNVINIENENANYASVVELSEKALEVFPNQAILYFYSGSAQLLLKNYSEAIATLEQGAKYARVNPDLMAVFYGQLGDAYNGAGNYEKSDKAFETVLKAQPDNEFALNNYSYYLSLRGEKLDRALTMSRNLVEAYPNNPTYLDTHAWVLYKMDKLKDAKKYLEQATQSEEASGIIFEHYGDVLFKLGQKNEAIEQWEKARVIGSASKLIEKKIADRKLYE